jgi:hypothetical protein
MGSSSRRSEVPLVRGLFAISVKLPQHIMLPVTVSQSRTCPPESISDSLALVASTLSLVWVTPVRTARPARPVPTARPATKGELNTDESRPTRIKTRLANRKLAVSDMHGQAGTSRAKSTSGTSRYKQLQAAQAVQVGQAGQIVHSAQAGTSRTSRTSRCNYIKQYKQVQAAQAAQEAGQEGTSRKAAQGEGLVRTYVLINCRWGQYSIKTLKSD